MTEYNYLRNFAWMSATFLHFQWFALLARRSFADCSLILRNMFTRQNNILCFEIFLNRTNNNNIIYNNFSQILFIYFSHNFNKKLKLKTIQNLKKIQLFDQTHELFILNFQGKKVEFSSYYHQHRWTFMLLQLFKIDLCFEWILQYLL